MPSTSLLQLDLGPSSLLTLETRRLGLAIARALRTAGWQVHCSASLASLHPETGVPTTFWERRCAQLSQQCGNWAQLQPSVFLASRTLVRSVLSFRQPRALSLLLDPLTLLFRTDSAPSVVLVHDLSPLTAPSEYRPGWHKLYRASYAALASSNCHLVACNEQVAHLLRVHLGIAPSRLTRLPSALPTDWLESTTTPAGGVQPPYLLHVVSSSLREPLTRLLHAYGASQLYTTHGWKLRIVGELGAERDPLVRQARELPGVELVGPLVGTAMSEAYRNCVAFVEPACAGGWGLQVLAALRLGCLGLVSATGLAAELAGDAMRQADPHTPIGWTQALRDLANLTPVQRKVYQDRAQQRAQQFAWPGFVHRLAALCRHLTGVVGPRRSAGIHTITFSETDPTDRREEPARDHADDQYATT